MTSVDNSSDSVTFGATQARIRDGSLAALSAIQQATTGAGPALKVTSENADTAAIQVKGAGDLLDLQDSSGVSQFTVTQTGAVAVTGDQTVTGNYTITGDLTVNGGAVFNEASADVDFRVESNGNANMLFVDASTDRVGIGTATPGTALEVTGVATVTQGAVINESGADSDTRIEGDTNVNLVFVDASTDRVGIGTATPGNLLDVSGGSIAVSTAGQGLKVAEGSNAKMGTLTLNGATPVVVSTTAVTASSRIFLTTNTVGGVPGFNWVSARTAATSFSVTGTAGDTSVVAWLLVEPA